MREHIILMEPKNVITTEFDHFDKSKKRLDILALDEDGRLVTIELKRDAAGTLADLQAIRYAAFCANMTFDEIVKLRARYAKTTEDAARQRIRTFLDDAEFSALNSKPRILLATVLETKNLQVACCGYPVERVWVHRPALTPSVQHATSRDERGMPTPEITAAISGD